MQLIVTSWDDISCEQGSHKVEVEMKEDWTPEEVAVAVDLAVERSNQGDPNLEATEYEVVNAYGMPETGFAVYTDDRDHISMLMWKEMVG